MGLKRVLGGLAAAGLLAGCSVNQRCESAQDYEQAETLPVPASVDGLTIPDSPAALRIPPPPEKSEPYGKKVTDPKTKDTRYQCLDSPPRLDVQDPPKPKKAKQKVDKFEEKRAPND